MAKKIVVMVLLLVVLSGCSAKGTENNKTKNEAGQGVVENTSKSAGDEIDIDITEEMYIQWVNEIYTNPESYEGQKIRIQGMFMEEVDETNGNLYSYVYRQGPGCCGNDGQVCGFEFAYDGIMPEDNDWIEVIGELTIYEENGNTYLSLKADSVRVQEERGSEMLFQ